MADRGDREQGDTRLVSNCIKALRLAGIRMPPGVDPHSDLRLFLTTLTASAMNAAGAGLDDPDEVNDEDGTEEEVAPVAMSLDRIPRSGGSRGHGRNPRLEEARRAFRNAKADRTVRAWDAALGRTPPGPNRPA